MEEAIREALKKVEGESLTTRQIARIIYGPAVSAEQLGCVEDNCRQAVMKYRDVHEIRDTYGRQYVYSDKPIKRPDPPKPAHESSTKRFNDTAKKPEDILLKPEERKIIEKKHKETEEPEDTIKDKRSPHELYLLDLKYRKRFEVKEEEYPRCKGKGAAERILRRVNEAETTHPELTTEYIQPPSGRKKVEDDPFIREPAMGINSFHKETPPEEPNPDKDGDLIKAIKQLSADIGAFNYTVNKSLNAIQCDTCPNKNLANKIKEMIKDE